MIEDVIGIVMNCGKRSSDHIDGIEAKLLALKIFVKLEAYGLTFDEDKFSKAVALNPSLYGVIGTVRKLLPPDEEHTDDVSIVSDQGDMFAALRAGQVDVAVTDTSIVLAEVVANPDKVDVVGQYKTGESYGAIYPKGNTNNATIDKIMQSMIDEGTIGKLGAKYLAAAWGRDPAAVPYFNP